jgi:sugar lactone lactonase YvrE/nicotinamidase-related amidase
LNAVRRLEQFAPILNKVLQEARRRGATIIHAPSDCMESYRDHPARQRAIAAPDATYIPHDVKTWCSVIPAEERGLYPIDQSDGGEDDDPAEHAKWRAELEAMGRNPNMPWKKQTELIEIEAERDFISDRGDEVWNILQQRGINNVILTGVHTNMCVLGRPFGLRQLARNGKHVVLMRDMTDTMYNPKKWPYVNHFEGTRRVIAHIERFVCPTITSDQLIGGKPFQFEGDDGTARGSLAIDEQPADAWNPILVTKTGGPGGPGFGSGGTPSYYRCVVRIPAEWAEQTLTLSVANPGARVWCNGQELNKSDTGPFLVENVNRDDANLIVISTTRQKLMPPVLRADQNELVLAGTWQYRPGDGESLTNMPLPAKFGGSPDITFTPEEPLWTPRPVTRIGEFTPGIEGPACDAAGNIFAVNYARQGTIGRVRPNGAGEVFVELPGESIGNGIRFAQDGTFYVADYTGHNVLRVDPNTRTVSVFAHHDGMHQPNDLAIAPDGTLYASDPNWSEGTGQLWRIDRDGNVSKIAADMGTTNGIEVSPDGTTLYVNESKQRNVWAFTITDQGITEKRLIRKFDDHGFDGMRCDVDGNLYITRYGKGTVVKMTPAGEILREIPVLGARPSNLCFGGPDRRTIYVTEVESTRLVRFRVDRPGR